LTKDIIVGSSYNYDFGRNKEFFIQVELGESIFLEIGPYFHDQNDFEMLGIPYEFNNQLGATSLASSVQLDGVP
jgi:hypothetical protein